MCSPDTHGCWPLSGHLLPPQIPSHHDPQSLFANGHWLMGWGMLISPVLQFMPWISLLVTQGGSPFLLWGYGPSEALLWGYLNLWEGGIWHLALFSSSCLWTHPWPLHLIFPHVLHMNAPEEETKLSHLLFPPQLMLLSLYFWSSYGHLHDPRLLSPQMWTSVSLCLMLSSPHAQPLIYSLRNKEVLEALRNILCRKLMFVVKKMIHKKKKNSYSLLFPI